MTDDSAARRLRVVIVDDEDLARAVLREYLATDATIDIVAECANGFDAVKAVAEFSPDLVFLDVQMPKLDGFEVLDLIGHDAAVVFVTADVHAVDYLLKPFSLDRMAEALAHAREHLAHRAELPIRSLVAAARPSGAHSERIVVRDGSRVHVIPVGRLDYVEAQDDYVCLHAEGKRFLKEQTMAEIEATLDPACFVRIHRSYILNIERLTRVEPYGKDSRVAVLSGGARLPVSRTGYARLNELL
jgi:two-component system LytT family response regulator